MKITRYLALLAALMLLAVGVAACGSDDSDDTATDTTTQTETTTEDDAGTDEETTDTEAEGEGTTLEVGIIEGKLRFDKEELTAPAGKVTFVFNNTESIPHNIGVRQDGKMIDETELISNDTVELTVDLEAGEYEFVCTPHIPAGMVGKLTIT